MGLRLLGLGPWIVEGGSWIMGYGFRCWVLGAGFWVLAALWVLALGNGSRVMVTNDG